MLASEVPREHAVCKVDDLQDGEMREFEISGDKKVLLIRQNCIFTAVGPRCTHYGAPLVKGALGKNRVRCPWHGACFNTLTGDIEDFPGLDSLAHFDVRIDDDTVKVVASDEALEKAVRRKVLKRKDKDNNRTVLIIGAGVAAQVCAETLRAEGFTGRVVLVTKEPHFPYDRPKLSKAMDMTVDTMLLRPSDFYKETDIEILTNKEATSVDFINKRVTFKEGEPMTYDKLLIATGGSPTPVNVGEARLRNVCLLRTPEDANYIYQASIGKNVVVNGAGFIGMETASFLYEKAASVTVVSRAKVPFLGIFGEIVGFAIRQFFEENGVKFCSGRTVAKFRGEAGTLTEVVLDNGDVLPADLCVNGLGVQPSTDFISGSGIPISIRGFIQVDKKMETEVKGVYAAGDVAKFPLFIAGDKAVTIGHWQMAHAHGKIVALNMLGKDCNIRSVPFFWSAFFKKSIRYAGYGDGYDDVVIHGNLQEMEFVAYYTKENSVVAMASMNSDPIVSKFAELLAVGTILKKEDISGKDHDKWSKPVDYRYRY